MADTFQNIGMDKIDNTDIPQAAYKASIQCPAFEGVSTQTALSGASAKINTSSERLASGLRINRASDDAAGLSISDSLGKDVRIFTQALRNVNDGISVTNTANAGLQSLQQINLRQTELTAQSANGTYSLTQRKAIQKEADALTEEFNRIINSTAFNGINLLADSFSSTIIIQDGSQKESTLTLSTSTELARTVSDGTFTAVMTASSLLNIFGTKDVNNDGLLDIYGGSGSNFFVSLQNPDGTYGAAKTTSGLVSSSNTLADFDGDGFLDILGVSNFSGVANIYKGNGRGNFALAYSFATANPSPGAATNIVTGDFNNDGKQDALFAYNTSNSLNQGYEVWLNKGNGQFTNSQFLLSPGLSGRDNPTVGDLNNDGILDIVSSNQILIGDGQGQFTAGFSVPSGAAGTSGQSLGDFNSDGILDLVHVGGENGGDGNAYIALGRGDGSFLTRTSIAIPGAI